MLVRNQHLQELTARPIAQVYYLVLTDTYWEFGPHGEGPTKVKGQLKWRIETSNLNQRSQLRRQFAT